MLQIFSYTSTLNTPDTVVMGSIGGMEPWTSSTCPPETEFLAQRAPHIYLVGLLQAIAQFEERIGRRSKGASVAKQSSMASPGEEVSRLCCAKHHFAASLSLYEIQSLYSVSTSLSSGHTSS